MSLLSNGELEQAWGSVERMFAVIVFDPKGNVINANPVFLEAMGYSREEIAGQHHRIFCDAKLVESDAYQAFWNALGSGERQHGTFRRLRKDGSEIFLYAEYAPLFDEQGQVVKVIKVAQNVSRVAENLIRQLGMSEKLIGRLMTL
ncbi:MAG: PAS domain-containing protein [Pseudomonadota bacterium]